MSFFPDAPCPLTKPGLFITATDTEIGKTVVTCAIAAVLRRQGLRVGVCKPYASGCRHEREGLVAEDAEAIAHFADSPHPLRTVNPVRFKAPMAPAAAAEREEGEGDGAAIVRALATIDADSDIVLVEGVGGLLVPLDGDKTVLDLALWLGLPPVVVTRPDLGTLNHTAMTCRLIRDAGLRPAGLVLNRYRPESSDPAEMSNPAWLKKQSRLEILATLPETDEVEPGSGRLPEAVLEAAGTCDWQSIARKPRRA